MWGISLIWGDVGDCIGRYCSWPGLWFFGDRDLPVIVVRAGTSDRDARGLLLCAFLGGGRLSGVLELGLCLPWVGVYGFGLGI